MMDEVLSVSAYITQETESEANFMDNSLLKKCDAGEARMMEKEMRLARRKTIWGLQAGRRLVSGDSDWFHHFLRGHVSCIPFVKDYLQWINLSAFLTCACISNQWGL